MRSFATGAHGAGRPALHIEERRDATLIRQVEPLGPYPLRLSDRILHWAATAPDRIWMAERDAKGAWSGVTYGELADLMRRVGTFLLDHGLSVEHPLLILSENSLEHALVALGAQFAGIPSAAVAPAYSLASADHAKLRDIAAQITPGMLFAKDTERFAPAIMDVFDENVPIIAGGGSIPGRTVFAWDEVIRTGATPEVDAANAATGPDTIAKFLFTSGTTGSPKAVIQTQRMMCSNMEMVHHCYPFLEDGEPPVVLDWSPWNHVAGGNKNFNFVLYEGGTFHIDGGRPTPAGMAETLRNIREISPTWYFNVPSGYDMLCDAMETDPDLAAAFFRRLKMIFYAGAGMAAHTWRRIEALSERTTGVRTLMCSGLGSTETAPFALFCGEPQEGPGNVGVPVRGVTIKLVPAGDKLELRVKGPNVTPGYWRRPDITAGAFDAEGFYHMGDALRPAVPGDYSRGFLFDGRTAENFKLQTGTWIAAGALRARLVDAMGGLVRDAVIAGENRTELGALLVPDRAALEALAQGGEELTDAALYGRKEVRAALVEALGAFAATSTGSSNRIVRALLLSEPLDFNCGEVTDKGSVNQRAVLDRRADLVRRLYSDHPDVIFAGDRAR